MEQGIAMRRARLFDGKDDLGNWTFDASRPRITDPGRRDRVMGFLRAGTCIRAARSRGADVLDPARTRVVSRATYTDGLWIWSAGIVYYLDRYGIAPEDDLLAHIIACDFVPVRPSEALIRRALEILRTG